MGRRRVTFLGSLLWAATDCRMTTDTDSSASKLRPVRISRTVLPVLFDPADAAGGRACERRGPPSEVEGRVYIIFACPRWALSCAPWAGFAPREREAAICLPFCLPVARVLQGELPIGGKGQSTTLSVLKPL